MLSLYEILKASKTGIAPDMWTALAGKNWGGADSGAEVKEFTGTPPLSIRSNGTMLLDYLISGNMSQTGTPTPTTPIQPQETGERTGNLWDEDYTGISSSLKYVPVYVGNGSFTLSTSCPVIEGAAALFLLADNVQSGASTVSNGVYKDRPITVASSNGYVTVAYRYVSHAARSSDPRNEKTMLNLGSTALPYEPYGYKLPISSAGQTNNIYLGNVETTRRIKKLVLDGTENWLELVVYYTVPAPNVRPWAGCVCTHCAYQGIIGGNDNTRLWVKQASFPDYQTLADFKAYLAQQYANGTPVTIWYTLTEAEIGIFNEPIRKIGNYADTVSYEQAEVEIPTVEGNTVIDVETTLKPSEMYIKYQE